MIIKIKVLKRSPDNAFAGPAQKWSFSMRGPRNFCRGDGGGGGPGPMDSLDNVFLVLGLFYSSQRGSNGLVQRKLYFPKDPDGGPTFPKGVRHFPGWVQMLISIETHITCDFPGEGSAPHIPPLDPHMFSGNGSRYDFGPYLDPNCLTR